MLSKPIGGVRLKPEGKSISGELYDPALGQLQTFLVFILLKKNAGVCREIPWLKDSYNPTA